MNALLFPIAFGAGVAIAIQAALNGQLAAALGGNTIAAALYSFLSGSMLLGMIALSRGGLAEAMSLIPQQPAWKLLGGLLGASAIFCTVLMAPRIGLANLLGLVIAGQLLSSLAIDHFALLGAAQRPVSLIKLAGASLMLIGVAATLFGDKLASWINRLV